MVCVCVRESVCVCVSVAVVSPTSNGYVLVCVSAGNCVCVSAGVPLALRADDPDGSQYMVGARRAVFACQQYTPGAFRSASFMQLSSYMC